MRKNTSVTSPPKIISKILPRKILVENESRILGKHEFERFFEKTCDVRIQIRSATIFTRV